MAAGVYDGLVAGFAPAGELAEPTLGVAGRRAAISNRRRDPHPLSRTVAMGGDACRTVQAAGTNSLDAPLFLQTHLSAAGRG